jgi:ComF family protein
MLSLFRSFYNVLFPKVCYGCGTDLSRTEEWLCSTCITCLPVTHYHRFSDNAMARLFWGRVELAQACSFLYFTKDGMVQNLLHGLKYHHAPEIGVTLGRWYGEQLKCDDALREVDIIIPVPLHRNKQQKRGYNQSEMFALGLGNILNKKMDSTVLRRKVATSTQTRKSRFERWLNVEDVFEVHAPSKLENKHVLLVDDVITTGATLEACALKLLEVQGLRLSIATIASVK